MKSLISKRLYYNKFTEGEFDDYLQLVLNPKVMRMITGKPLSIKEAQKKFETIRQINLEFPELGYFKITKIESGEFIGMGKLTAMPNQEAELGYSLLPHNWGKGYGTEISTALILHATAQANILNLIAIIDPENEVSKRILKNGGFILKEVGFYDDLPSEIYSLKTLS